MEVDGECPAAVAGEIVAIPSSSSARLAEVLHEQSLSMPELRVRAEAPDRMKIAAPPEGRVLHHHVYWMSSVPARREVVGVQRHP